jgi:hypothetical protein
MGNSALLIRVYKTGENVHNCVTKHVYNTRTALSRNMCALGALRRTTPSGMSLRKKLFFNSFRDEEKHYTIGSPPIIKHVCSEPYS